MLMEKQAKRMTLAQMREPEELESRTAKNHEDRRLTRQKMIEDNKQKEEALLAVK
jgi:hypothetical protein